MEHRQSFNSSPATGEFKSVAESMARGREAIGTAATEAMESAGSDWLSLRSDLNEVKDKVTKYMSQAGREATKTARDITSDVASHAGGVANSLAGNGAEMVAAANVHAKAAASDLESMVRRNPIGAIAGAAMVGIFIGLLGRRG